MNMPEPFRALRIRNDEAGYRAGIESLRVDELTQGEVLVQCAYSSVNYKDALAGTGKGAIQGTPTDMERHPCVYILASRMRGTLYVGVTSDLIKRVWQHKNNVAPGFTQKYHVHDLVWFEQHEIMESAILREKAIKSWQRMWKIELIESTNSAWVDLYAQLI